MKKLITLVILLTACSSHIPPTRTEKPKQDLAKIVAKELRSKKVVVIHDAPPVRQIPDDSTSVYLCQKYDVGPYTDSALDATVRALNSNREEIDDCANKQLKALAAKYNLQIK